MHKHKKTQKTNANNNDDKTANPKVAAKMTKDRFVSHFRNVKQRERAFALCEIIKIGPEVLGGRENLFRWLTTPNWALGGKMPLKLMIANKPELVRDVLYRIEYGIIG